MTYGEIIDRERPRNIKDTISKDEKEIIELYKESDKQRLINESSTGYEINGAPAQYVHTWAIDMDITSEYPTAMCLMNMSNDTFVAKILLANDEDIKLPMYDAYELFKWEEATYMCNKAAVLAETIAQSDFILAGSIGFGLPTTSEVESLLGFKKDVS